MNFEILDSLEQFVNDYKEGKIELTSIENKPMEFIEHFSDGVLDCRVATQSQQVIINFHPVRKKPMKTQAEVYQDLFILYCDTQAYIDDNIRRLGNRYAVENTVKVWREQ